MSYYDGLVAVLTILLALVLVICVVGAAWWLMWKLFLSRFQFINEILFPPTEDEKQKPSSRRKVRKE